jgi:hypothetical protein
VARADRLPLKIRAARWAGTVVRVTRRPFRSVLLAAPGLAGAYWIAVGVGQIAGHIFARGLAWWVTAVVGGVFLVRVGSEINATPTAPRQPDE